MGQSVDAKIDVFDAKVHCQIMLPGMLSLFAAPIEAMLRQKGDTLLLGDDRKNTPNMGPVSGNRTPMVIALTALAVIVVMFAVLVGASFIAS